MNQPKSNHAATAAETAQHPLIAQAERWGAHNYHPLDVVIASGEGVWLTDTEGRRFLDMLSAYSAVNQGHRHPHIIQALIAQAQRVTLTSRAFHNDRMGPFLEQLCALTGYESALPMNTGAEAVETAIKAARKWGYQVKGVPAGEAEIIVATDNFHGRTTTIVGFSTEPQYREGFGPFTPGFKVVSFGDVQSLEAAFNERTVASFWARVLMKASSWAAEPNSSSLLSSRVCVSWLKLAMVSLNCSP